MPAKMLKDFKMISTKIVRVMQMPLMRMDRETIDKMVLLPVLMRKIQQLTYSFAAPFLFLKRYSMQYFLPCMP
jgi:hypothetical protein